MDYTQSQNVTDLAYDLRQIYAKIVGEHLIDISENRKANNFYNWYKSLEDLHTIVRHKFKDQKKDEERYNKVRDKVTTLANKYKNSWLGVNFNPEERGEIEEALRQLEEYLYKKMSDAKMFGESWKIAGL